MPLASGRTTRVLERHHRSAGAPPSPHPPTTHPDGSSSSFSAKRQERRDGVPSRAHAHILPVVLGRRASETIARLIQRRVSESLAFDYGDSTDPANLGKKETNIVSRVFAVSSPRCYDCRVRSSVSRQCRLVGD